jgi:hypothetical protein
METDEIRAAIQQARRACAEADLVGKDFASDHGAIKHLSEILAKLTDAAEELLTEREIFAGRLKRTPAKRPAETAPAPSTPSSPDGFTPSPAPDA